MIFAIIFICKVSISFTIFFLLRVTSCKVLHKNVITMKIFILFIRKYIDVDVILKPMERIKVASTKCFFGQVYPIIVQCGEGFGKLIDNEQEDLTRKLFT